MKKCETMEKFPGGSHFERFGKRYLSDDVAYSEDGSKWQLKPGKKPFIWINKVGWVRAK